MNKTELILNGDAEIRGSFDLVEIHKGTVTIKGSVKLLKVSSLGFAKVEVGTYIEDFTLEPGAGYRYGDEPTITGQ